MSAPTRDTAPATPPPQPPQAVPATAPPSRLIPQLFWLAGLLVLTGLVIFFALHWWSYRRTHSVTADAFVEAHIVNIAPQTVSGHIVRFPAEENDQVKEGEILVELDPEPYQVQVDIKKAAVLEAEKNLAAATAEARGMVAQTRSNLYKLTRAMEDVNSQVANLSAAVNTLDSKKADLQLAEADLKRGKELLPQRAMSQEAVDTRERAVKADAAAVAQALDQIYAIRVGLGLPREPEKGRELTEVPPDLDQNFSTVRDALGDLYKSAAQLGYRPSAFDAAPKPAIEEFYQQDKNRNLNAIYTKLINDSPVVTQAQAKLQQAKSDLDQAQLNLRYTRIRAPFPGIVVKRYSHLGDFATPGVAILSMYNPDLTYVTANLEEDRLPGVAPGNQVELQLDAFDKPFCGRVVWINKSSGAQFSLMPRNVVAGEFTKVVQRVPVRIAIEKDERWPLLRAGLSVRAAIDHGQGDPTWAARAAREMKDLEARYNVPPPTSDAADPGERP